jgi:type 1 fimbriae regulatory protein FimB/type 1 fimbriae regulatory protein FimE
MKTARLRLVTPATENSTVAAGGALKRRPRRANAEFRTREHLTTPEVHLLIEAAKANRYGRRDALMILLAFRHALRASEIVDLRWEQVDFKTAFLHVRRVKNGTPATHPLTGREMRELRRHQRESAASPFVFVSERGAPLSAPGFSRMVERAGIVADLGIKVHAHMLRHAAGYKLANDGHDTRSIQAYMGHRNIQNTARYTALAPGRFKDFWRD